MIKFIKQKKRLLINILSIVIFILLILYIIRNMEIFNGIKNIKFLDLVLLSSASVLIVIINAILNHSVLMRVEKKIKFSDTLMLQYANNFLNKVTSHTGIMFRGLYLRGVYSLDLSKFLATIAGVYIISFGVNACIGIISSYFIYQKFGIYDFVIIILLFCILLISIALMVFSPAIKNREGFIRRNLGKMLDGWQIVKSDPKMIFIFLLTTMLITFATAIQQNLIFNSIGKEIDISRLFLLSALSSLTLLISFTPGGIGIREAVFAFTSEVMNINVDILLLSSLLSRGISFFTSMIFGGLSYLFLIKKLKNHLEN